jgi:glycosyltransferase involved in cell wall biosynthesis
MMQDERRLKVLFLPAWYPSEINAIAGISIKEFAEAASAYNDIVVLYVYPDPYPQRRHLCRASEDIEDGIRTIRVRYSGIPLYLWRKITAKKQKPEGLSDSRTKATISSKFFAVPRMIVWALLYYWSIFSAFRRLVKGGWKPDIIHAHVFTAGVPAVFLGKLYKIPVVITEHHSGFAKDILTFSERLQARFAMNRAAMVLPLSEDLERHIKAYGIRNKFSIHPSIVDTKVFHLQLSRAKDKDERKKILTVSFLFPRKGIHYLLEALGSTKRKREDFSLEVVGDGPSRRELEQLATNLGLDKMVKFHGVKPKQEVAQFMMECDFFVLPSLWETFGQVYIQAMACGKPVVAFDVGGPNETINRDVGILVPPKDVKALREAIEYMLDNYQNYSSEKIAQYAEERFGYEAVGRRLDIIYHEIVRTVN